MGCVLPFYAATVEVVRPFPNDKFRIIASAAKHTCERPRQNVFAKNRRFLIALYFSHHYVFSYKNLTLCRESIIFLEYPKFFETFLSKAKLLSDINL
jgi:hypothetical protein